MNLRKVSFSLIFGFVSLSLFAQTNYDEAILLGDKAFERAEYTTAIKKYLIAEAFDRNQWKTVQEKLDKVYKVIDATLAYKKIIQSELEELRSRQTPQLPSNVAFENPKDEIVEPASPSVDTLHKQPHEPLVGNDSLRLHSERPNQWFVNVGYGLNVIPNIINEACRDSSTIAGHSIGLNFGGRYRIVNKMSIGYHVGIGVGFNPKNYPESHGVSPSNTYLHWSAGVKFYPWNCFFVSASCGATGMKYYEKIIPPADDQFVYKKMKSTKFYHGISLMGGADICFWKNPTNKFGGVINIAAGTVCVEKKWGLALNLGVGLVF